MTEFRDRDEAKAFLMRFVAGGVGDELEEIVETCVDEFLQVRLPRLPPGVVGLVIPKLYWVIRDDDLTLFDAFAKAAAAAASTNVLAGSLSGSAAVGLITAAFGLYRQIRKKGATLTMEQCHLLGTLRRSSIPMRAADVSVRTGFPVEDVEKILLSLTTLRCADGTLIAAVSRDVEGLWAPAGV